MTEFFESAYIEKGFECSLWNKSNDFSFFFGNYSNTEYKEIVKEALKKDTIPGNEELFLVKESKVHPMVLLGYMKEADNTVSTVESEMVESEAEESIATESSELMEEQEMDAMTEAVLPYITVARVEKVVDNGTLDLTLFELPEASKEVVEDATETTGTEETGTFDFASLDLSIFVEAGLTESYQPEETVMVQLVEDGSLAEAALSDIQEGDMLVIFMDENELPNIVIYRNVAQEEAVTE